LQRLEVEIGVLTPNYMTALSPQISVWAKQNGMLEEIRFKGK
jgi:hypothetical protein